jgi:hypothetical protein
MWQQLEARAMERAPRGMGGHQRRCGGRNAFVFTTTGTHSCGWVHGYGWVG